MTVPKLARLLAALPLLGGLSTAGVVTAVGPTVTTCASAATIHHAALVVEHGSGRVLTYCVGFDTATVTGDQMLHASGFEYATQDFGSYGKAVCQIDHEPAQYPPGCWTGNSPYWAFYVSRGGGRWSASSLGVTGQTFHDGDAAGFRYEGQSSYLAPPSAAGVCPTATPPPTATPSPRPTPTASAAPSASARPTAGAASSASPLTLALASPAAPSSPSAAGGRTPGLAIVTAPAATPPRAAGGLDVPTIAAAAIGIALLALLIGQLVRARRTTPAPGAD